MSLYYTLKSRWKNPANMALKCTTRSFSWAELDEQVQQAASFLFAFGLKEGDVLALQLKKSPEFLFLHLAALSLGVITLPLNDKYTSSEVDYFLGDSNARAAILQDTVHASIQTSPPLGTLSASNIASKLADTAITPHTASVEMNEIAVLCYTSGTTGKPKGALITHGNLLHSIQSLHQAWRWCAEDTLIHALPLFHIHGLYVAQFGALYAGSTTVWLDRFDPELAIDTISKVRSAVFMGVPTFYSRFLAMDPDQVKDVSSARLFTSGSAPLPARIHEQFEEKFGHQILERYGMTEVGIVLSNPYEGPRRPGTVGTPLPGIHTKIVDPETGEPCAIDETGILMIRGPSVMLGYLGRPEQTAQTLQNGWMRTGDYAKLDATGYFTLVGRASDMIISGGYNVYPREVENRLLQNEQVSEAAVFGVLDQDLGECVVAQVISAQGKLAPLELMAYCRKTLAPYKCPKVIRQVIAFPRNAMGKVQKNKMRTAWEAEMQPSQPTLHTGQWSPAIHAGLIQMIQNTTPQSHPPFAAFDFDNTCIAGDIGEAVLREVGREIGTDLITEYQQMCLAHGRIKAYAWCAEMCANRSEQALGDLTRRVFKRALSQGIITIRPEILNLIQVLQARKWEVWIVSASAQPIVKAVAHYLEVPESQVIGMRLQRDPKSPDFLLPNALTPLTMFEGKVTAIMDKIGRYPDFAAGDSDTDLAMLEAAPHALAIDRGEEKLATYAGSGGCWLQKNWETTALA